MERTPDITEQVEGFLMALPDAPDRLILAIATAVDKLAEVGPTLGRPLVDQVKLVPDYTAFEALFGHRLKELRPLATDVRILFTFAPDRTLVLLYAGDKAGEWKRWYRTAIPEAARLYREYLEAVER